MTERSQEIMGKLVKVKAALPKLGKAVKDADRAKVTQKVDALIAELHKLQDSERQWKKDRAAVEPFEKKLKEIQDKLEPKTAALNAKRLKFSVDAKAAYAVVVPVAQALFKQKTEKQANEVISMAQEALLSAEGSFNYKLTSHGKADL